MSNLQKLRIAALASVCVLQLVVAARAGDSGGSDNSAAPAAESGAPLLGAVTFGVGAVTPSSAVYGRYNGMPDSGIGVLAGWNLHSRDPWDSGTTHYFNFTGDNINFGFGEIAPEAAIRLDTGDQGVWGISASYSAMTYVATDDFKSILDKSGNLSPAYQAALILNGLFFNNTTAAPPASAHFGSFNGSTHLASSNPVTIYGPGNQLTEKVGTRRDKGALEGSYDIGSWIISAGISHEHKGGSLEQTMTTGGNNAGMVTFPMPIDYDTDVYTAAAVYEDDGIQAKFSYEFSNFIDHNDGGYAFAGWNFSAYKNVSVSPNTYTSYARSGDYALPPSNQAHTFTGEIGYNVDPQTRLTATAVYGLQLQDEPFVPATTMGYIFSTPGASLAAQLASNPGSLNGLVHTFFGNAMLTSMPLPDLDIKVSYTIDSRHPHTDAMWIYGDPTDNTSLKYRQAVPEAWTKQQFSVTAGYKILQDTRVTLGYTFRDDHRTNAITHDTRDNEESVDIHSVLSPEVTGSLGYVHAERTASAPDWSLWLVQIPSDCGSTLAALGCQQVPFYEAARTQDSVTGMLTGMIGTQTSVSLFGKYNADEYHDPAAVYNATLNPSVGINRDYSIQAGPDANYQIDQDEDVHVFYTFLRNYRAMRALNNQSDSSGGNYYIVDSTYDIQTAGIGGTWRANDRLKFAADYIYSYGGEAFAQSGTWNLGYTGDPKLNTKSAIHQIKVHADYDYSSETSFYLGYEFDSLDMNDWALVGALAGQVLTGDVPPKYNVSKIMAAMTVKL